MSVVLVTQGDLDLHAEMVKSCLDARGRDWTELKLGLSPSEYVAGGPIQEPAITYAGQVFTPTLLAKSEVLVLRFAVDQPAPVQSASQDFLVREWTTLIESALWLGEAKSRKRWLVGRRNLELIDKKIFLLEIARSVGGRVPEAFISHIWPTLDDDEKWVVKAMNAWQEVTPGKFFNTRLVADFSAAMRPSQELDGPLLFQRYVPHEEEWRVYIAGSSSIAVRIVPSGAEDVDFRIIKPTEVSAYTASVPAELEGLCRAITGKLGLQYCAFDFIPESTQGWLLLDVNPVGSWDYLDVPHKLSITESIVNGALKL